MRLSIVIVSWNTRELLERCLRTVFCEADSLPDSTVEVFVVDNNSSDGSAHMVGTRYPQVHLLENSENLGFAAANNRAIRQSVGEYVLLLNPDTEVKPGALAELVTFMDGHPNCGAAGPRLLNGAGALQVSCYPFPTLAREIWRLMHLDTIHPYGTYRMTAWPSGAARMTDTVQGACLMVRQTALEKIGLLDEAYFLYTEEVDLCYRIRQEGWDVFWVPGASVIHHGGQSTRLVASDMFLQLYSSKVRFFRKHYGESTAESYKVVLFISGLVRVIGVVIAALKPKEVGGQYRTTAANYWRLLQTLPKM